MNVDPHTPPLHQPASGAPANQKIAASLEVDEPPAPKEVKIKADGPRYKSKYEGEKGQIAWHAFKLFCVVLVTPVALPFVAIYVVGWTLTSLATSENLSEFKQDVKDVFHDVLKPYTRQYDGIVGGLVGLSGKGFRFAKRQQAGET